MPKPVDEFSIIAKYFAPLAGEGAFNLQDDAAIYEPTNGKALVITQDAIAEGVHFFKDDPADLIAQKALRVNLSDLAAKGAEPKTISIALGLPKPVDEEWLSKFSKGLKLDIGFYNLTLTGGDTFHSGGGVVISITAIGEIDKVDYKSRLGASVGDKIYVTGTIGDGALGLLARQNKLPKLLSEDITYLENRYLLPLPRCEYATVIAKCATASMDISDGLVGDLAKLCKASNVAARLDIAKLPLSNSAQAAIQTDGELIKTILSGGDDYELLFTISAKHQHAFEELVKIYEHEVCEIGEVIKGKGVSILDALGQDFELEVTSYNHLV